MGRVLQVPPFHRADFPILVLVRGLPTGEEPAQSFLGPTETDSLVERLPRAARRLLDRLARAMRLKRNPFEPPVSETVRIDPNRDLRQVPQFPQRRPYHRMTLSKATPRAGLTPLCESSGTCHRPHAVLEETLLC
jgi:hypothetical protein